MPQEHFQHISALWTLICRFICIQIWKGGGWYHSLPKMHTSGVLSEQVPNMFLLKGSNLIWCYIILATFESREQDEIVPFVFALIFLIICFSYLHFVEKCNLMFQLSLFFSVFRFLANYYPCSVLSLAFGACLAKEVSCFSSFFRICRRSWIQGYRLGLSYL